MSITCGGPVGARGGHPVHRTIAGWTPNFDQIFRPQKSMKSANRGPTVPKFPIQILLNGDTCCPGCSRAVGGCRRGKRRGSTRLLVHPPFLAEELLLDGERGGGRGKALGASFWEIMSPRDWLYLGVASRENGEGQHAQYTLMRHIENTYRSYQDCQFQ